MTDLEARLRASAHKFADSPEEAEALVVQTLARIAWRREHGFKVCSTCKQRKKPEEFGLDSSRRDGLRARCKPCDNEEVRSRRA